MTNQQATLAVLYQADWPQPEFALGELVYLEGYSEPVPVQGLYYTLHDYEGSSIWVYEAGGYLIIAGELSREPWPVPVSASAPALYAAGDNYDPFLDGTELP